MSPASAVPKLWYASEAAGELAKTQIASPVSLGGSPRTCISSKFSGDADIVETILWESLPHNKGFPKDTLNNISKVATTNSNLWFSKSGNLMGWTSQFNFISVTGVLEFKKAIKSIISHHLVATSLRLGNQSALLPGHNDRSQQDHWEPLGWGRWTWVLWRRDSPYSQLGEHQETWCSWHSQLNLKLLGGPFVSTQR